MWYLQEVEGVRTDVRAVNLSYLATDWYIAQMQRAAYDSKPLPMYANAETYAYDKRQYGYLAEGITSGTPVTADELFKNYYNDDTYRNNSYGEPVFSNSKVLIPANVDAAIKAGVIPESMREKASDSIAIDLTAGGSGLSASQTMIVDLVSSSIAGGWKRPVYFATTIPESLFMGLTPYMLNTGMAYQISPVLTPANNQQDKACNTDKMYDIVTKKFKWGGLDKATPGSIYLDETVTRMVTTTRSALFSLADALTIEGDEAAANGDQERAADRYKKAENVLDLMSKKIPIEACPYQGGLSLYVAQTYANIGLNGNSKPAIEKAKKLVETELMRYAKFAIYYESLVDEGLDDRMSQGDLAAVQQLIPAFFEVYRKANPNGVKALINKFQNVTVGGRKISPETVQALTMSYDEREKMMMMQQQMQAEEAAMASEAPDQQQAFSLDSFAQ